MCTTKIMVKRYERSLPNIVRQYHSQKKNKINLICETWCWFNLKISLSPIEFWQWSYLWLCVFMFCFWNTSLGIRTLPLFSVVVNTDCIRLRNKWQIHTNNVPSNLIFWLLFFIICYTTIIHIIQIKTWLLLKKQQNKIIKKVFRYLETTKINKLLKSVNYDKN